MSIQTQYKIYNNKWTLWFLTFWSVLRSKLQAPVIRHTTFNQHWIKIDSTSWRWISSDSMLIQHYVCRVFLYRFSRTEYKHSFSFSYQLPHNPSNSFLLEAILFEKGSNNENGSFFPWQCGNLLSESEQRVLNYSLFVINWILTSQSRNFPGCKLPVWSTTSSRDNAVMMTSDFCVLTSTSLSKYFFTNNEFFGFSDLFAEESQYLIVFLPWMIVVNSRGSVGQMWFYFAVWSDTVHALCLPAPWIKLVVFGKEHFTFLLYQNLLGNLRNLCLEF